MRNIALHISYDGTNYHGFQRQNNAVTIQQLVETAIFKITKEKTAITGCSRTDAGVHARDYVCNFKTESRVPPDKFPFALNTALPPDIRCFKGTVADDAFHARFSAKSKIYSYKIYNFSHADALLSRFTYHYPEKLDLDKMLQAAHAFVGKHDFTAFMAAGGQQKTTVKNVYSLKIEKTGNVVEMQIHADGYLYNMVRIIAGTLIYVGCGKLSPNDISGIIEKKDRENAGITAPPQGLCLEKVFYSQNI